MKKHNRTLEKKNLVAEVLRAENEGDNVCSDDQNNIDYHVIPLEDDFTFRGDAEEALEYIEDVITRCRNKIKYAQEMIKEAESLREHLQKMEI